MNVSVCRDTGSDLVEAIVEMQIGLSRNEVPLETLTLKQAEAMKRLREIAKLPPNWDSYGSPPPTQLAIRTVMDILLSIEDRNLPSTRVVPVSGGGIQLEWRVTTRELQLEISSDGTGQYLQIENGHPIKEEEIPGRSIDRIRSLVMWLIPRVTQRRAA